VGQVGNAQLQGEQLRLHDVQIVFDPLEFVAQRSDLVQQGADILPAGLGSTDGLGARVALVLQFLSANLQALALGFQSADQFDVQRITPPGEFGGGLLQFGSQQFRVKHESRRSSVG